LPQTPGSHNAVALPRVVHLALCATTLLWAVVATSIALDAAQGIALRLQLEILEPLLTSLFLLFLLLIGFRAIDKLAARGLYRDDVLRLPARSSRGSEWGIGAVVGWGLALTVVLPIFATNHLHGRFAWRTIDPAAVFAACATLLVLSLAEEMIFRGYPFQRLSAAIGKSWAAVLLSVLFAVVLVFTRLPVRFASALLDCTLFGLLLAMAYLRTHSLWLGWGLHFTYRVLIGVALGLPLVGHGDSGSLAQLSASGPAWLGGGSFGPDAALLTAVAMLLGMAVLFRATREFAWQYTHSPIFAAGYEVAVAPPAAHIAMEKAAPAPPPLVQILPVTPRGSSDGTLPDSDLE
jgi:membrane protease YdiL (CAAX protease family)